MAEQQDKQDKHDKQHKRNVDKYGRKIDAAYKEAIKEAVAITKMVSSVKDDAIFSFDDYPYLSKRVKRFLSMLQQNIMLTVVNGIQAEWTLANNKNNELAHVVFGKKADRLTEAQKRRYFSTNDKAREAFITRKEKGLSLSDRVWRYTDQFKEEIEMSLDIGIREGKSAAGMARDAQQYLQHPDMLFRRVRDEHGQLQLSKRAKAYHPGQGVYRSSYKNARRLAATETNIAYRTADHLRYQQLDFVVGIEIHLSGNHTLNGKPFRDICDELAGRYPKDFKFTGWHPNCRCFVTSILKTKEERDADVQKILRGEPLDGESVNRVKDVPENFKKWVRDNSDRMENAQKRGMLPYFVKDNMQAIDDVLNPKQKKLTTLEIAEQRHAARTQTEIKGILNRWNKRVAELEASSPLNEVIDVAQKRKIVYKDVAKLQTNLTTDEIINRLSGGDKTKGSCSSVALAYAGNKAGFDVHDFRGGMSQKHFSEGAIIRSITEKVGGITVKNFSDYDNASELLGYVAEDREYYFTCGKHAAIVRKKGDEIEYLELQSPSENGWKLLNRKELKKRFGAQKTHSIYKMKYEASGYLIDIQLLQRDFGFRKLLGYINTEETAQKKGKKGTIK